MAKAFYRERLRVVVTACPMNGLGEISQTSKDSIRYTFKRWGEKAVRATIAKRREYESSHPGSPPLANEAETYLKELKRMSLNGLDEDLAKHQRKAAVNGLYYDLNKCAIYQLDDAEAALADRKNVLDEDTIVVVKSRIAGAKRCFDKKSLSRHELDGLGEETGQRPWRSDPPVSLTLHEKLSIGILGGLFLVSVARLWWEIQTGSKSKD